jgi:hypothetical protein
VHTFVDRGVSRGQRGGSPTVVDLGFLDRRRCFFIQVAPRLSSQGLSGLRSRATATQKIWQRRESNPEPLGLQPGSLYTEALILALLLLVADTSARGDRETPGVLDPSRKQISILAKLHIHSNLRSHM